jgi:hypothetical protein
MVGNKETEHTIAEEFQALEIPLHGGGTPTPTTFGDERARMGQCLIEEFAAGELVTDDVPELLRRQNPSLPTLALIYAAEQPAIANRERPFPELPKPRRPVGRKKDELGPSD